MSYARKVDARRFGFCVRCLQPSALGDEITEHHTRGRSSHLAEVVFICRQCHDFVEALVDDAREAENARLLEKTKLLVTSSSLRFVVENRERVLAGFNHRNRDGPSISVSPNGIVHSGDFGAVGRSERRYYYVVSPQDRGLDQFVEGGEAILDGIGGAGSTGGPGAADWIRYRGGEKCLLNKFIRLHEAQGSPGCVISGLRQD